MEKQQVEITHGALQTRVDVSPGFLHDPPSVGRQAGAGLRVERFFSVAETDPLDTIHWERRDALISGEGGKVFFDQRDVEAVPKF